MIYLGARKSVLSSSGKSLAQQIAALFSAGEQGAWYDPSDFTTLFQDSAGTTPVTAVGQPVGKMLDKSGRGNHATQPTAINRPVLQIDGNGKYYLQFNGTNSWMSTAAINFTTTDKMMVVAGVRIPGTTTGMLVELSASTNTFAGTFYVAANEAADRDSFRSRGSLTSAPAIAPTVASPRTRVIVGIGDIAADGSIFRVNSLQVATSNLDQGTGNFGNYPLYIGARAGTSLFFNGQLYGLVIRGALSTGPQITSPEKFMAGKTGISL